MTETREQAEERRSHRRKVRISPMTLAQILDLPESASVVGIHGVFDPMQIEVVIEDPNFGSVLPECATPVIPSTTAYDKQTGRVRVSYDFQATETRYCMKEMLQ